VSEKVAAGLVRSLFDAATRRYGIPHEALLSAATLDPEDLSDPSTLLPLDAMIDALRFLISCTGDAALGLSLAEPVELRKEGHWGYALLSSLTLRQRFEIHVRYQRLRSPITLSFWEEDAMAVLDTELCGFPADVAPVVLDWGISAGLNQLRSHLRPRSPQIDVWLTCAEKPHHGALRALAGGSVVFSAPFSRIQFPAALLDVQLAGDSYLGELVGAQLDALLKAHDERASQEQGVLQEVRTRIGARLARDLSLPRIARELRVSARTLQRQLDKFGVSFQQLLEEVRRARAMEYLLRTDEAIERIATLLGYGDPSNFRRAFRRWTGVAPTTFRAEHRAGTSRSAPSVPDAR
jgi:AraC-like DNA-binding protein